MILIDTSVWIDHLHTGVPALTTALDETQVLAHPYVIGELACGNLQNRQEIIALLQMLPQAPVASDAEILAFIEERDLMGKGLGFIDVHLLASTLLAGSARLWTRDRRLKTVAETLGVAYQES